MAGLQHLIDIYQNKDKEFIDLLFNKTLVVSEKPNGSFFSLQQSENGKINFYKRNDRQPITTLDRTIISLYEPPIEYIEKKVANKELPKNIRFGFEYFQNTKPFSISYDRLPKNGLVLTHMKELDDNNKVIKFIDDTEILSKWAKYFAVEEPFVIFKGNLSKHQKDLIEDFLSTPFNDLVHKFKTTSFTKYIISILNPKMKKTALNNTLSKPIEGLVFKFNDGEYLAKLVDPLFMQIAREQSVARKKKKGSSDDFGLIIYTFINWIEEYDILKDFISNGETTEDKYVDLMTRITKRFIDDNRIFLTGVNIKKLDFAKAPEFSINTKMIKNKEVVEFIENNSEFEEIFKILLSGFRKTRKRKTNTIDNNVMRQINSVVTRIQMITSKTNEEFLSFSDFRKTI